MSATARKREALVALDLLTESDFGPGEGYTA